MFHKSQPESKLFISPPASNGIARTPWKIKHHQTLQGLFIFCAFLICVAALTREPSRDLISPSDLQGPVAKREIRSTFYFETVDLQRTQEAREQELARTPDFYRVDESVSKNQVNELQKRIINLEVERENVSKQIIKALAESDKDQTVETLVSRIVTAYATSLKEKAEWKDFPEPDLLALWLMPDTSSLPQLLPSEAEGEVSDPSVLIPSEMQLTFEKSKAMGSLALEVLETILKKGVRSDSLIDPKSNRKAVMVPVQESAEQSVPTFTEVTNLPDQKKAEEELSQLLTDMAQRKAREMGLGERWAQIHDGAFALAKPLIVPTITFDEAYTQTARIRATETVSPVMKEIEAGEIIQDRGRRWTLQSRSDAETYMRILSGNKHPFKQLFTTVTAHIILVLLVFWGLYKRVQFKHEGNLVPPQTAFNLALLLLCVVLVVGRIVSYFEPTGYIMPVAAAGILYAILVGPQRAALFGALIAALISAQYQYNWRLMLVGGAMTIAGAFSTYGVRKRSDVTTASLVATVVGVLSLGAAILATDTLFGDIFFRRIFMIVINGVLCLFVVPGLLPWLEKLFGITTDIQLLEYSDLNNPLLRKLAITAPATYAHSLLLGQIAEAAANAIGANGLLARVCAYYHDIGKQFRPDLFTENQNGQTNIHESLPPKESADIIRQHVIEGVREAMGHNLPQPIIDGILEHHGTSRISYFYELARRQNPDTEIDEMDFRYPGPKPQRPETAILMICDAAESGIRSLKNPSLEVVRQFIDSIIRARAEDNQFEDCDLTLKQLAQIRNVVAEMIVTALHTRVPYPRTDLQDQAISTMETASSTVSLLRVHR